MQLKDASVHCKKISMYKYLHNCKYTAEVLIEVLVFIRHYWGNTENWDLNRRFYLDVKA